MLNFREENFRDQKANHEIHENIVPRKFGAIWYIMRYCMAACFLSFCRLNFHPSQKLLPCVNQMSHQISQVSEMALELP